VENMFERTLFGYEVDMFKIQDEESRMIMIALLEKEYYEVKNKKSAPQIYPHISFIYYAGFIDSTFFVHL
jgi:hypothetical protein